MNREYEFRGKDIETEEWYYGGIYQKGDEFYIVDGTGRHNLRAVQKDSVGQYTGREESRNLKCEYKKKKIYEGDIIIRDGWCDTLYLIEFEDCKFVVNRIHFTSSERLIMSYYSDLDNFLWPVVIGNKSDNPGLLIGLTNVDKTYTVKDTHIIMYPGTHKEQDLTEYGLECEYCQHNNYCEHIDNNCKRNEKGKSCNFFSNNKYRRV